MTARRKLAPLSGVARSLPTAAVLVLAGLALVSLASSSRPTELETTPDSDGSLTSTTATTAPLPDTAEETPSSVPTTSSDQSETLPATSTPDDLQAEDAATTSTPDSATPTSVSPTSGSSAVTASSTPSSTLADDPDDTTPTTESGQGSETSSDATAPATDASADPAEGDVDPEASEADDDQADAADAAEQGGVDTQEEQTQDEPGEQDQGEQDETALADGQSPPEEERSLVQDALAMLIALLAVLGLLSLLVPPLWSLLQRFRGRKTDESLRHILWQWFRGLWSKSDDDVVDAIAAAPLINPIAMLDRLRTELESEPDPRSAVRKAYAAVESGFGDDEKARHTGETPTAYLERALGSIIEGENRPLAQLTYLFLLARYSQHDITEAMRSEAIDAVVELRSRYRQVEAVLV